MHLQSSRNFTVLSLSSIISLTLPLHAVALAVCAVVESLLFCCSAVHKVIVNLLLLPIQPVTVYSHHSRTQDFNLNRGICSSTGWCILWFSGDGNLNPPNSPICHGGQTGHSFVVYSDLWKWFNCHWNHSCDVAIFIYSSNCYECSAIDR